LPTPRSKSSDPADGSEIDEPIEVITVVFTGAAAPAGEGFQVLTPAGVIVVPTVEVGDDQRTFTLTLAEPLVDGTVGVRWSVRAGDAHPIEGSFSFTTTAVRPPPTAEPTATPTPLPTTAASPDADDAETNRSESDPAGAGTPIPAPTVTERAAVTQLDDETDSADPDRAAAAAAPLPRASVDHRFGDGRRRRFGARTRAGSTDTGCAAQSSLGRGRSASGCGRCGGRGVRVCA